MRITANDPMPAFQVIGTCNAGGSSDGGMSTDATDNDTGRAPEDSGIVVDASRPVRDGGAEREDSGIRECDLTVGCSELGCVFHEPFNGPGLPSEWCRDWRVDNGSPTVANGALQIDDVDRLEYNGVSLSCPEIVVEFRARGVGTRGAVQVDTGAFTTLFNTGRFGNLTVSCLFLSGNDNGPQQFDGYQLAADTWYTVRIVGTQQASTVFVDGVERGMFEGCEDHGEHYYRAGSRRYDPGNLIEIDYVTQACP